MFYGVGLLLWVYKAISPNTNHNPTIQNPNPNPSEDYNGRSSDICRTIDVYDCSLRY